MGLSIKPRKVKLLAGEQKATEIGYLEADLRTFRLVGLKFRAFRIEPAKSEKHEQPGGGGGWFFFLVSSVLMDLARALGYGKGGDFLPLRSPEGVKAGRILGSWAYPLSRSHPPRGP